MEKVKGCEYILKALYLDACSCVIIITSSLFSVLSLFFFAFTERGVCLPTVSLWILFVYIEAAIRFKDLKNFHVDLCRPFAAHW
jgi:hypothetical protein